MSTRQQRWAQGVFERLEGYAEAKGSRSEEFASKYRSLARKLPTLLQQSGLIQGMIFARTRKSGEMEYGEELIRDVARIYGDQTVTELVKQIQNAEMREYLRLSEELISLAVWFRRYATVLLKSQEGDE